jgi:uncharacterized protein
MRTHLPQPPAAEICRLPVALMLALPLLFAGCARGNSAASEIGASVAATREEQVRLASGKITLAGTLVLPPGAAPHAAVVLFHGSGPQERDLFTARWFAAQGIAALAYDKRGTGQSTGDFRTGPFMDLCDDGLAAIGYLKSRSEIDAKRIGVWGLSQGGWLGPLAASRSADVAWVIAVSGPGVSPGEQMIVYYANELRSDGAPERDVREAGNLRCEVYEYLFTGKGYEQVKADLDRARTRPWYGKVKMQQDKLFERLQPPAELNERDHPNIVRFAREMHYDPVPALQALRVPALFLFGDQDQLIPVEKSKEVIQRVLMQSGHRDFTIRTFHNADHGMYLIAGAGAGDIDPEYLDTMRSWLAARHLLSPPG